MTILRIFIDRPKEEGTRRIFQLTSVTRLNVTRLLEQPVSQGLSSSRPLEQAIGREDQTLPMFYARRGHNTPVYFLF